jgi:hypothetical protein
MERTHGSGTQAAARKRRARKDAIALLKADHREVEGWFAQFKRTRSIARKEQLAGKICDALKIHTTIEEEIFYPAFLAATDEKDMHHEAEVEHAGAKKLISEIESADPGDDYYDARVKVLSVMIKHHVIDDEKPGGIFAEARKSDLVLDDIGDQLKQRKAELQNGGSRKGTSETLFGS